MVRSVRLIDARIFIGAILVIAVYAVCPVRRASAQTSNAPPATTISGGGITLHSVKADFPDRGNLFPGGDKAEAINNNCLACHSAGMVLTQPHLSKAEWQGEVDKMRNVYKAPVVDSDVPAIVDYLVSLGTAK
jgi:hypothetical protein